MGGLRSMGALLAALLALGAYIYFVTWRQPDPAESRENRVYPALNAADITEFTLQAENGDVTTVRREDGTWRIVAPRELPVSIPQVNGMTSMIAYLDIVRVIDENPSDLAEYGLQEPRIRIDFKAEGEQTYEPLLVGHATPTGASLYAKLAGEPRVFLIGQHHEASLSRTTFDLREKRLVAFTREEVDSFEIVRGLDRLAFERKDGRWVMTAPFAARADFTAVDTFLGSIEVAQMRGVATDEPPDAAALRQYGLTQPAATVTVHVDGQTTIVHLGAEAGDDTYFARVGDDPPVMTVERLLANDLLKPLEDFRRRELFELQTAFTTRIEITRGGETVTLERDRGEGADARDVWRRTQPGPAGEADRGPIDTLLGQLQAMRADAFVPTTARTGLDAPVVSIRVEFNEREDRVDFGRNRDEVYASRPDEPGAMRIDAGQLERALSAIDDIAR